MTESAQKSETQEKAPLRGGSNWDVPVRWSRWLLVLILLVGAYLRLSHLNWDQGTHIHPDERFLTMVESALQPAFRPGRVL